MMNVRRLGRRGNFGQKTWIMVRKAQLSIAGLMVVVAIVALAVFWEQTRRRRLEYRKKYNDYNLSAHEMRALSQHPQPALCQMAEYSEKELGEMQLETAESLRRFVDYFEAMRDKYATAMRRPWLPVESDPPAPDPE